MGRRNKIWDYFNSSGIYISRGRKKFFSASWGFGWDPCNKRHIKKRKAHGSLLTLYMYTLKYPEKKWVPQKDGLELWFV